MEEEREKAGVDGGRGGEREGGVKEERGMNIVWMAVVRM